MHAWKSLQVTGLLLIYSFFSHSVSQTHIFVKAACTKRLKFSLFGLIFWVMLCQAWKLILNWVSKSEISLCKYTTALVTCSLLVIFFIYFPNILLWSTAPQYHKTLPQWKGRTEMERSKLLVMDTALFPNKQWGRKRLWDGFAHICVNCPVSFSVVLLFWFLWGEFLVWLVGFVM